jgi:hypothetical protein
MATNTARGGAAHLTSRQEVVEGLPRDGIRVDACFEIKSAPFDAPGT